MATQGSRSPVLSRVPAGFLFVIAAAATGIAVSLDRRLVSIAAPGMFSLAPATTVAMLLLATQWIPIASGVVVATVLLGALPGVAVSDGVIEAASLVGGGMATALLLRTRRPFDLLDSIAPFVTAAVAGAAVGSALAGIPVLGEQAPSVFLGRWMSDAVGILLVGGLILALATTEDRETIRSRSGITLLGISFALSLATFVFSDLPLLFVVGAAAVVAGTRFGPRAVMADALAIAAGAVLGLAADPGAVFVGMTVDVGLAILRTKLVVFVVAGLAAAHLARDRERAVAETVAAGFRHLQEVQARADIAFLADLSENLEGLPTLERQAARLAELVSRRFQSRCSVVIDDGGDVLTVGDADFGDGSADRIRRLPFAVGDARGELVVELREPESWDRLLAVEVAARAGRILSQARVREIERGIALRLQRGLLTGPEVCVDGVETAARYEAGDHLLEVGGDWYDILELPGGLVAFVVGDVVGHGVEAAAAMGRLRTALAALAPHTAGPAELLRWLDRFALGDENGDFATVVCAILDPATGLLRYASAGHPPMLAVLPDGRASWLAEGRSPPICSAPVGERPEAAVELEPGTMLVLYSDGLVESRDRPLDKGLDELSATATALRAASLEDICDHLMKELGVDSARDDDVVILAIRYVPVTPDIDETEASSSPFPMAGAEAPMGRPA